MAQPKVRQKAQQTVALHLVPLTVTQWVAQPMVLQMTW
jgi:hypothetical protein